MNFKYCLTAACFHWFDVWLLTCQEDSDAQSVVSSYCDVSGGQRGYEESSLHILNPDCQLYLCDGDNDEDSTDRYSICDLFLIQTFKHFIC